ncbi:hypothetical protein [Halomonas heilongjiangensis]|uniref:DUF3617 domain-containing protein n=1 Tax=Halomonas heilongjiangensis TaxID=1387883 RepID=A0A2N7TG04_9GAMM|nr:hypothetical protein [Halomonas heilongjiangensis]PMR67099.1 hypothetical protein C1H66_20685 [Halomonas heilongjiangensis]PXX87836.1 hypothetical protein CR158_15945 [Halomonas heilongjiangensis]
MLRQLAIIHLALALVGASPGLTAADWSFEEAFRLYQEVLSGKTQLDQLSPEERRLVLMVHEAMSASEEIEGHDFSLRDVERRCEVYKYDEFYGEVECSGSALRPLERACEAYFYDGQNGELECRGSDFRVVERKCTISMYSEDYGEIDC